MRKILLSFLLVGLLSNTAQANPVWQSKPVQCATPIEVYEAYVFPNELKPVFIAVGYGATSEMETFEVPIVFYMNKEGRWLMIEVGTEWTCVVGYGDRFDSDITEEMLNKLLLGMEGT